MLATSLPQEHVKRFVLAMLMKPTTVMRTLRATTKVLAVTAVLAMRDTLDQALNALTQMVVQMIRVLPVWRASIQLPLGTDTAARHVRLDTMATVKSATTSGTVLTTRADQTEAAPTPVPTLTSAPVILAGVTLAVQRQAQVLYVRKCFRAS